jgi:Xaa-Pro aminopeptidase
VAARARALEVLARRDAPALVLTRPGGVNWRSGGLSDPIDVTASSDSVWSVDTPDGSALITTEIEAPRLERDFRVRELGWELLSVPWFDANAPARAASEFAGCAIDEFLSDRADLGRDASHDVVAARLALSAGEQDELRDLGDLVGRALVEGVEAWTPGESTDYDVAAVVSAALVREGAAPVCLIVGGDERLRALRHPLAVGQVVSEALMVVVVARRAGLHAAATRLSVARADDEITSRVRELVSIEEAVLAASRPGGTWGETVDSLERAYDVAGYAGAWREHFQGGPIGFEQREFELAPGQGESPFWHLARRAGTAVAWNPSLTGGAKLEDTYLISETQVELVTASPRWPDAIGSSHGVLVKAER